MMSLVNYLRGRSSFTAFVIYLRYLLGGAFVYSGIGKAMGGRFIQAGSLQIPPQGMTLDVFFETLYRTGIWWQFLGYSQVIAGLLLATQRFSSLGALLFLPISLNIFMITISMDFHATPFLTGSIVLANIGLLCWDFAKLTVWLLPNRNINLSLRFTSDQLGYPHYWESLGLLIFFTSISFGNRENPPLWFIICFIEGMLGYFGWWFLQRRKQKATLSESHKVT